MERDVKVRLKRNRRRERAERMHAQREAGDSAEDDSVLGAKPPRPPIRRKKLKDTAYDEDIIDGFAILAFKSYEELEVSFSLFGLHTKRNLRFFLRKQPSTSLFFNKIKCFTYCDTSSHFFNHNNPRKCHF